MRRRVFLGALAASALPVPARAGRGRTVEGPPTLRHVASVATGLYPKSVARAPAGRLWVCHFGRPDGDNVWVFEPERLERVGAVDFEGNAVETAFDPGGARAYVSNFRRGTVHAIDPRDHRELGAVWVGPHPKGLLVSPSGHRLYAANYSAERVSIVDTRAMTLVRHVRTGVQPRGMAMRPDGSWYVASFRSRRVQHFGPDGDRLGRFTTCPFPRHLQLAGNAPERLFVSCSLGSVGAYDAQRGRRVLYARTGGNPRTLGLRARHRPRSRRHRGRVFQHPRTGLVRWKDYALEVLTWWRRRSRGPARGDPEAVDTLQGRAVQRKGAAGGESGGGGGDGVGGAGARALIPVG